MEHCYRDFLRSVRAGRIGALQVGGLLLLGIGVLALPQQANAQVVPGRYIAVLNDNVGNPAAAARQLAATHGLQLGFVYEHAIKGFSFGAAPAAAQAVARSPLIAYVEPDLVMKAFCHTDNFQVIPTGIQRAFADENPNLTIDGTDDLRIDVDIAIIDTGIDFDHFDLNVVARTDCSGGNPNSGSCDDDSGDDGHGHGTHVAGSAAAIDNGVGVVGVAPGARLWAVKVLNNQGSGFTSWIIAGVDYVTAHADQIEVANMSLGGTGSSSAQDAAIANSIAAGVVYVVAAGNSGADASGFTPANHPDVITVSGLADSDGEPGGVGGAACNGDADDTNYGNSNHGDLIEIAAPGVCILSTFADGMCAILTGTSMASPHVAGAAALLASGANAPTNKAEVDVIIDTLLAEGNFDWTDNSGDGILEPLLDVSNSTVFDPATVPGDDQPSCSVDADCDDADDCTTDTCTSGVCSNDPINCDDGDACTTDSCSGGFCSNDPISCDDGDPCTTDSCDSGSGCVNTDPPCQDNDGCCPAGCDSTNDNDCVSCTLGQVGDPCTDDADCCSDKCRGRSGAKTCK